MHANAPPTELFALPPGCGIQEATEELSIAWTTAQVWANHHLRESSFKRDVPTFASLIATLVCYDILQAIEAGEPKRRDGECAGWVVAAKAFLRPAGTLSTELDHGVRMRVYPARIQDSDVFGAMVFVNGTADYHRCFELRHEQLELIGLRRGVQRLAVEAGEVLERGTKHAVDRFGLIEFENDPDGWSRLVYYASSQPNGDVSGGG